MDENLKHYNDDFFRLHLVWKDDYPIVAKWIEDNIEGKIFGDIGCGNAYVIESLYGNGKKEVWGVDGASNFEEFVHDSIRPFVRKMDLSHSEILPSADVAICFEVAEHLDFKFSDVLISNIASTGAKTVLFTAAPPGQPGINHINLQYPEFWIKKMENYGYKLNDNLSKKFKTDLTGKIKHIVWLLNNIMVFEKNNEI